MFVTAMKSHDVHVIALNLVTNYNSCPSFGVVSTDKFRVDNVCVA